MRRIDAPALAAAQGAKLAAAVGALPGVASVRGRGLLLAAELESGDAKARVRAPRSPRPGHERRHADRAAAGPAAHRNRLELDEAVGIMGQVLA